MVKRHLELYIGMDSRCWIYEFFLGQKIIHALHSQQNRTRDKNNRGRNVAVSNKCAPRLVTAGNIGTQDSAN